LKKLRSSICQIRKKNHTKFRRDSFSVQAKTPEGTIKPLAAIDFSVSLNLQQMFMDNFQLALHLLQIPPTNMATRAEAAQTAIAMAKGKGIATLTGLCP